MSPGKLCCLVNSYVKCTCTTPYCTTCFHAIFNNTPSGQFVVCRACKTEWTTKKVKALPLVRKSLHFLCYDE